MPAARARVPAADSPNARSAKSRQRHPPPRGLATALAFSRIVTPPPPRELPQGRDGLPTAGPTGPTRLSRTSSPCPTSRHRPLPAARFPGHPAHGHCRRPPRTPPDRPMPDLLPRVFVRSSPPASAAREPCLARAAPPSAYGPRGSPARIAAPDRSGCCARGAWDGGADRDRTGDLMLAKHALSQLSYGPVARPAAPPSACGPRDPPPKTVRRTVLPARRAGRFGWWAREDLNLRPHAYQARALTN